MKPPNFSLAGKVALVTGSSTGLGKAMAFALGRAGAKVAFNYAHNGSRAEATFEAYRSEGLEGGLFRGDVVDEQDVPRLCRTIAKELGPIDILVVNATPEQPLKPIEEYDWAFHQSMLDFFVKSPYLLAVQVLPHMKRRKWGRIVNITSEVFQLGVAPFSPYVAAKGAQCGWMRSMATELAPFGITSNAIAPGWIPVERHEKDPAEMKEAYRRTVPMGEMGVPEDLDGAIVFLASGASRFVTGQTIHVNGGHTVF
ncbi:MAG: SDR family NAD(P)-dependent oxidoreductase [Phycisphaerales bacterium]